MAFITKLAVKRVYENPSKEDGCRILVDRLWPRGISKDKAELYKWAKEIAPSGNLRKEFCHEEGKYERFKKEYIEELDKNPETENFIWEIKVLLSKDNVTFLYGTKDTGMNNAVVLRDYVEEKLAAEQSQAAG
jgi:uncharacterized protein YeaO (DUF488 family)